MKMSLPRIRGLGETNNPFSEQIVTEQIEDPGLYHQTFSEQILVGETLRLYQPLNIVLTGPQGTGKTMLLNLMRPRVLARWVDPDAEASRSLPELDPFFAVTINLTRAGFHVFGQRDYGTSPGTDSWKGEVASSAADYLAHYLLREYVLTLAFLRTSEGVTLRRWMRVRSRRLASRTLATRMRQMRSWGRFYSECESLVDFRKRAEERLRVWREYLNSNRDDVPEAYRSSKVEAGPALHDLGNELAWLVERGGSLPLYVVIDQYEELPRLVRVGRELQRVVNTLMRSRDPVVYFKIGARPYDWGPELRVSGSEARLELLRDYRQIDLTKILARRIQGPKGLFARFAEDVARRRARARFPDLDSDWSPVEMLGNFTPSLEAERTLPSRTREQSLRKVIGKIPPSLADALRHLESRPLDLRLAGAWVQSELKRGTQTSRVAERIEERPWGTQSWRGGRIDLALLQIARLTRRRKFYAGWNTVVKLSGLNISIFLLLLSQIWDVATKAGANPLAGLPIEPELQAEGVYGASEAWRTRDSANLPGGAARYKAISAVAPRLMEASTLDYSMSNPGSNGFSVPETAFLAQSEVSQPIGPGELLRSCVNYAIMEERRHNPRGHKATKSVRLYLHAVLSPALSIPTTRIGDPIRVPESELSKWIRPGTLSLRVRTQHVRQRTLTDWSNG